ncbi:MAG: WecB/TagA/CpsF family glycosyltransferase [Anaerolineaceae bacterium]|nr:WecB/TagA/CpsF family glycosyltransferase [Anaerolineaceae bacterium]
MPVKQPERGNILGVGVSAINMQQALDSIDQWVRIRSPHYVCVTPAHTVMDCYRSFDLRQIYNCSGLTTPDGMAIVWLLKWQGFRKVERVYGPDLLQAVCQQSLTHGYSHYFYGGAPGVAESLTQKLVQKYHGLRIAGIECPPFRELTSEEDEAIIDKICAANPDIVWIGIGSPRQERWMVNHLEKVKAPVMIGIGAAFDFVSGNKPQAPLWMQRSGLEWFFRLANEPRRLWRRYLLNYPQFVVLVLLQMMKLKRYPMN